MSRQRRESRGRSARWRRWVKVHGNVGGPNAFPKDRLRSTGSRSCLERNSSWLGLMKSCSEASWLAECSNICVDLRTVGCAKKRQFSQCAHFLKASFSHTRCFLLRFKINVYLRFHNTKNSMMMNKSDKIAKGATIAKIVNPYFAFWKFDFSAICLSPSSIALLWAQSPRRKSSQL